MQTRVSPPPPVLLYPHAHTPLSTFSIHRCPPHATPPPRRCPAAGIVLPPFSIRRRGPRRPRASLHLRLSFLNPPLLQPFWSGRHGADKPVPCLLALFPAAIASSHQGARRHLGPGRPCAHGQSPPTTSNHPLPSTPPCTIAHTPCTRISLDSHTPAKQHCAGGTAHAEQHGAGSAAQAGRTAGGRGHWSATGVVSSAWRAHSGSPSVRWERPAPAALCGLHQAEMRQQGEARKNSELESTKKTSTRGVGDTKSPSTGCLQSSMPAVLLVVGRQRARRHQLSAGGSSSCPLTRSWM